MKGFAALAISLLIIFPLVVLVPDLMVYGIMNHKASSVVEQIVKEGEMRGGITSPVQARATELMKENGLDDKGMKLTYSSTGSIEHRGRFTVEISGEYKFKSFNLLGTGIGEFSLPIDKGLPGYSEVWTR